MTDVGVRGISVRSLVKHVYNMNCTFFAAPELDDVRTYVRRYVVRNSRSADSLLEHADRRGYYRLNTFGNADARQLVLQFHTTDEVPDGSDDPKPAQQDLSLDLFG